MSVEAEDLLKHECAMLDVEDILALCYSFAHETRRMTLYLDVLRKKGGQRAQFASCLICFDLARQGSQSFINEFNLLMGTVKDLAQNQMLVDSLVAEDPYLEFVWDLCRAQLEDLDERFEEGGAIPVITELAGIATLDLLSDDDFGDFGIPADHDYLWVKFDEAVMEFLGGAIGRPVYDVSSGFRLKNKRDTERCENFLRELDSLKDVVPLAIGYRALTLLFYGSHMRSKAFFGGINLKKQHTIREGLTLFRQDPKSFSVAVGSLSAMHASPKTWPKIADILEDYIRWMGEDLSNAERSVDNYDVVDRIIQRASA